MRSPAVQTHNYSIGEILSYGLIAYTLNIYIMLRMILSCIYIYNNQGLTFYDNETNHFSFLLLLQWVFTFIGFLLVLVCFLLYSAVTPIIEEQMKEVIFMNLEGNQLLFDNFYAVT